MNTTIRPDAFLWAGAKNSTSENPFTIDLSAGNFANVTGNGAMFSSFGNNKATIYVKDAEAQAWIISQNNNFNATNVLIK